MQVYTSEEEANEALLKNMRYAESVIRELTKRRRLRASKVAAILSISEEDALALLEVLEGE